MPGDAISILTGNKRDVDAVLLHATSAGDLEGATTAMQEATRKLAASEVECSSLRQQLAAKQRLQQQLEFDVAYLRSRRVPAVAAAATDAAAVPAVSATHSCSDGTAVVGAEAALAIADG
jgi:hypothetical protein